MNIFEDHRTCHDIGISGNCGDNCPLLLGGDCPNQEEMEKEIPQEECAKREIGVCRIYDKAWDLYRDDICVTSKGEFLVQGSFISGMYDRYKIERCSDKQDITGQWIFEGDIVESTMPYKDKGVVTFSGGIFWIKWQEGGYPLGMMLDPKITGNVHKDESEE
ncbi:MAG: hypothetical protein AB1454_04150 [Candidatus Auribacterota bacterium]